MLFEMDAERASKVYPKVKKMASWLLLTPPIDSIAVELLFFRVTAAWPDGPPCRGIDSMGGRG